jgi:hypothetical protein
LSVCVAFSDESSSGDSHGPFLMDGFVAPESDWPCVKKAWQERVLDGPPVIPLFHMRDIRDDKWRAHYGVTARDADCRISEASQVLDSFGNMAAIVSVIQQGDLNELIIRRFKKRRHAPIALREPDYFCFVGYVTLVLGQVSIKWPEARLVNFFVSSKQNVTHHLQEIRNELEKALDPNLRSLLGEVFPAVPLNVLPLQYADALLWHVKQYYDADKDVHKMKHQDRKRLAKMSQYGDLHGMMHEWERSEVEAMAQQWIKAGVLP